MRFKYLVTSLLVVSSSLLVTSCGGEAGINADMLTMGVTDGGLILRTAAQSCADKRTTSTDGTITRSLTAPVLSFAGMSIQWLRSDFDLYIGAVQITVTGSKITGGSQVIQLDATEMEALLGAPGSTLTSTGGSTTKPGLYSSTSSSKGKDAAGLTYYPCGLAVGGLSLVGSTSGTSGSSTMPTSSFTVSVEIELIGTATSNASNTEATAKGTVIQKTVMKTIQTTATYY